MGRKKVKCPPGHLCIDTVVLLLLIILGILIFFFITNIILKKTNSQVAMSQYFPLLNNRHHFMTMPKFGMGLTMNPRDILSNPYVPPLRNGHYFQKIVVILEVYRLMSLQEDLGQNGNKKVY